MTTYVIADLHLGEANSPSRRERFPSADHMFREILARWNDVVNPNDVVYVLGDVGQRSHLHMLSLLHGAKHLIAGNADDVAAAYRSKVFASVRVARWVQGFLLTHIPVHPSQLRSCVVNVHGHLHAATIPDPRYRCVSVEQTNYAPVTLDGLRR